MKARIPTGRTARLLLAATTVVSAGALAAALAVPACGAPVPHPPEETILVGTAMRTINPPLGAPLVGYPSGRPNTGVALDLCARAAAFGTPGNAEPAAALVVLDVIQIDLELGRAIRQQAAAAVPGLKPSAIMVSATHTHSGPERLDERAIAAAAEAVAAAWKAREEVRARIGHARARLGHNRRVVDAEGKAKNEWKDPEGLHTGLFNPDVPFVEFDDARTGEIRAVLVSYGCHPVVCGPGNTKVSADYPGYLVRALESATKARTAIFTTGAAGDINPREPLFAEPEKARPMGESLAAEVLASLPQTRALKAVPIAVVSASLRANVRPEWEKIFAARMENFPEGPRVVSEVQALRMGDLAFLGVPGELVAGLGLAIQNSSPFANTVIVYNANDHLGYLISDTIRREGGHEMNEAASLEIEKPLLAAAREALAQTARRDLSERPPPPGTLLHDFDRDAVKERLTGTSRTNEIQRWDSASQTWKKTDYALPANVSLVDDAGHDAGLRFVDLNGDGFDDILFSNSQRYAIHLWTKTVRLDLGWPRGWSQFVRTGPRTGGKNEPPSLVGAEVRVADGQLIVTHPASDSQPVRVQRLNVKELIAFDMPPPKSPEEALASFRVRWGFRVELVAAEPVVIDPISFDWGADGRLWVVEMRDYPMGIDGKGKPGGVVKVIEDTDGDGRFDKVVAFLEGVAFPSSVMPWRKGALIAAAPDLFYAEDTDGDGRADVRKVLFTGFKPGNQQHRFNGFEWGLDGWIYAANGDSGGTVKSLATGKVISISGRDIRFRPDTGEIETVSAETQFGRRRDDWGNWFGNNNPTWLWHVTLPEHYLRRNPRLAVKSVRHVLANYDNSTRVFPVSATMVRPNQPQQLNHVTSGCSPTPYRDDLFGPEFATTVFASEPVHNAIHREVLVRDGAGFTSHRAAGEEQSEFLASTDNWFRPITTKTGPDGALYVADMYRFSLEHPEWISPEMQARLDVRAGEDKGRIYRVVPEGKPRRTIPNLAKLNSRELAIAMDSPNGWQRDMAQRLLVERADRSVTAALQQLLGVTHAPQVRLQALATLGLLGALTPETLLTALGDPHPAVRCEALRQSEPQTAMADTLFPAVAALAAAAMPPFACRRRFPSDRGRRRRLSRCFAASPPATTRTNSCASRSCLHCGRRARCSGN